MMAPNERVFGVYQWMENEEVLLDLLVWNSLINKFAQKRIHYKFLNILGVLTNCVMSL
jgi:hypothetical protein